ncbi:MAG TPA: hypothetical protein VMP13_09140 [Acidimicrobiia bacterium]|nr:hypothetical protein [Acidimicrobiia bacterium]
MLVGKVDVADRAASPLTVHAVHRNVRFTRPRCLETGTSDGIDWGAARLQLGMIVVYTLIPELAGFSISRE